MGGAYSLADGRGMLPTLTNRGVRRICVFLRPVVLNSSTLVTGTLQWSKGSRSGEVVWPSVPYLLGFFH